MCCPGCTSENVYFSRKKRIWICEECELEFEKKVSYENISSGADYTGCEYWTPQLWDVAPVALALSYHQLYEYVAAKNIGCTLFLIRDVFELMIKIPVTIIFNGIHELSKDNNSFALLLKTDTKAAGLYEYSMQMLSTGKWWECVRLACSLDGNIFNGNSADVHTGLYTDTIRYLKQLHKLLYFKVPGKQKNSMVTWRNRTLGHSCLADNPEEKYNEIPYILEMFRTAGEVSTEYYSKVCLTDGNKNPLCGIALNRTGAEVYIQYIPQQCGQAAYSEIHNFIAGRDNNLSCFDGFEKGKAYLLNYSNGERYTHQQLSELLTNRSKVLDDVTAAAMLSREDVFSDNLETKDIRSLEEQLSVSDDIISVSFLGRWLMDAMSSCDKGMLLLTAERGLGKSTFCSTLDPFEGAEIKYCDEAYAEELAEFLGDTAVRVWHFNSEYRSRKDIFIPGIRDALLTLAPESGNRICGTLESQYNNLLSCAEDLRSLYFTECLNNTMGEYRVRTDKQQLLLIFDGIDEVSDIAELCSFMPDPSRLNEDVYILLTSRTKQEIRDNKQLTELIEAVQPESHLDFTRENITVTKTTENETHNENTEYREVVSCYVGAILREQGKTVTNENIAELAQTFEYRFSSLAAYRKLCRLSCAFNDTAGTDLFGVFIHKVENNAPETYVKRLKRVLNTLVYVGEPITLRELAFLSGERYVSYCLLGMMNDIQAFIKVTRSSRGNCYELSHSQWEDAVKALVPYGDIYFRKQCNELIAEMESFFNESNIELIIEKTYEGELWLLKHILGIYNRSWKELKENWFEEARIGSFEYLIKLFLSSPGIMSTYFTMDNADEPYGLMKSYSAALEAFGANSTGIRGSKEGKLFVTNSILSSLPQIYEHMLERTSEDKDKQLIVNKLALCWNRIAVTTDSKEDRVFYRKKSIESYRKLLGLCDRDSDIELYTKCLYNIGSIYHLLDKNTEAKHFLMKITELCFDDNCSYNIKDYLSCSYIRLGQIYEEAEEKQKAYEYYQKATKLSCQLVEEYECASSLDTLEWAERVMSFYYEDTGDIEKAIEYRESALSIQKHLIEKQNNRSNSETMYRSLCKLGELYEKDGRYSDALRSSEEALTLGFDFKIEDLLDRLVRLCIKLNKQDESERYSDLLEKKRESKNAIARAYAEVLVVLRHMKSEYVDKIPKELINTLYVIADHDYKYGVEDGKIMSNLSENARGVLAVIYDYWDPNREGTIRKQQENEDKYRLEKWKQLKQAMLDLPDLGTLVQKAVDKENKNAFCEAYWLAEHFPFPIIDLLSIEKLMWVKQKKGDALLVSEPDYENLSAETLAVLRYVIGDLLYQFP